MLLCGAWDARSFMIACKFSCRVMECIRNKIEIKMN